MNLVNKHTDSNFKGGCTFRFEKIKVTLIEAII